MQKIFIAAGTVLLAMLFTACGSTVDDKILSVSVEPQKYFLEAIVGDKYQVHSVMPAGVNPESFDPTPSQMVNLSKSKIYFKVGGLSFENVWTNNVKSNNPAIEIVDCSVGLEDMRTHEHEDHREHEGMDPHIWSSPRTATVMANNMLEALMKSDASNKEYYIKNYNQLLHEIAKTDNIIQAYLAKAPSRSFLIYHPSLGDFANQYGLKQYSIEHEGKSPSPMQLRSLIDQAKREGVKVVFMQQEYDEKNAKTIAKEIGAKIVPVNLMSYDWSKELINIAKALSNE